MTGSHIYEFFAGSWVPGSSNNVADWVYARDRKLCRIPREDGLLCLEPATEIDHIVPRSRGGGNEHTNLRASCRPCNRRKRDKLDSEMYT